jgi:hypothetical protein
MDTDREGYSPSSFGAHPRVLACEGLLVCECFRREVLEQDAFEVRVVAARACVEHVCHERTVLLSARTQQDAYRHAEGQPKQYSATIQRSYASRVDNNGSNRGVERHHAERTGIERAGTRYLRLQLARGQQTQTLGEPRRDRSRGHADQATHDLRCSFARPANRAAVGRNEAAEPGSGARSPDLPRGPTPGKRQRGRGRTAVRLANPNPHSSRSQIYAERGLIDGLLMPKGGFGAFVRRQLLPSPEVLNQQARHGGRRQARSRLGRGAGVLARYGLTMSRLLRVPERLR